MNRLSLVPAAAPLLADCAPAVGPDLLHGPPARSVHRKVALNDFCAVIDDSIVGRMAGERLVDEPSRGASVAGRSAKSERALGL